MDNRFRVRRSPAWQWGVGALAGLLIVGVATREVSAGPATQPAQVPAVTSDFEDVPDSGIYTPFINNLYETGIVSGYTCGGTNPATGAAEPCIGPANRPYYRPGNTVSRQQMSKFIDLGRRNIATATGVSLALSGGLVSSNATVTGSISAAGLTLTGPATGTSLNLSGPATGTSLSLSGPLTVAGAITGTSLALTGPATGTSLKLTGVLTGTTAVLTNSLTVSGTASIAVNAKTTSSGEAVRGECLTPGANCWAIEGYTGVAGNYAGVFAGGKGISAQSADANAPAVDASATGATSYGSSATSTHYRGAYVHADNDWYGLFVDNGGTGFGSDLEGDVHVGGNLVVTGSKTGYVVDVMQNADSAPLEAGDVVTIVGNAPPVIGQIPVVRVKRAASAYDTGVVGIVDQVVYVPDAPTKAAYLAQEQARRTAMAQIQQAEAAAKAQGSDHKADLSGITMPDARITDEQGNLHAVDGATQVAVNGYTNVVTLGSYKAVKVDASFGAVHAGDLLTSSPHAGYAMKVSDKAAAGGAVIGKALGDLSSGTGLIPLMVTLK